MDIPNYFPGHIGQKHVIDELNAMIDLIATSAMDVAIQPYAFLGEAGLGKTNIAEKIAPALTEATGEEWTHVEINPLLSPTDFLALWMAEIEGKNVVIFYDEVHDLDKQKRVVQWVKRLIETDDKVKEVRADLGGEVYVLTANPMKQFWVCATNEDLKDSALIGPTSRFKCMYLTSYQKEESIQILVMMAARYGLTLSENALDYLADRTKRNARAIKQLAKSLRREKCANITIEHARSTAARDKRFPGGLDQNDIQAMLFLSKSPKGRQVGEIACHLNEDESFAKSRLRSLAGMSYVLSNANKRTLTEEGRDYLVALAKLQKEAAAKHRPVI